MIRVDTNEPDDLVRFMGQAVEIKLEALNQQRLADYAWTGESVSHWPNHDGSYHLERKTWQDLAGGVDEILDQLREQQQIHPRAFHRLLIEGAIEPHMAGVLIYQRAAGRNVMTPKQYGRPGGFKSIVGAIAGIYEYMDVYISASYPATAATIIELYMRDQKPEDERETFRKHFKPMVWHPNANVVRLLGMAGRDTNIGVEKAEALINKFGTAYAVCSAKPEQLAEVRGISKEGAVLFLRKIGRLDV